MALPAGTIAGDLGILLVEECAPTADGWSRVANSSDGTLKAYIKRLTAADVSAGSVVASGSGGIIAGLTVLSAAGGVGRVRWSSTCYTSAGGVAVWFGWLSPWRSGAIAASTYRIGAEVSDPEDGWDHALYVRATSAAGYYTPGSVHSSAGWLSIEVQPLGAPLAPVWVSPTSGEAVDRTQSVACRFAHQSAAGVDMDACRVAPRPVAGSWSYVAADGTLSGTSVDLVRDAGEVTLAASQLTANTTYEVQAFTHDEGGWSPASSTLTLVARTPPTLVVTLTTAAGDVSPTVSWVMTPGYGTQTAWEVWITPSGSGPAGVVEGWHSGLIVGAETSWQAPASDDLTNGGSYVAWVMAADGALRSAQTASAAQTVSWTAPAAPAAVAVTDGTPLSVAVAGIPAGSTRVALQSAPESEDDWTDETSIVGPSTSETITVPLAPYGVERRYRARAWASVDGVDLPSAWVTSAAMASTDLSAYLVAEDGSEWVRVRLLSAGALVPVQGVSESSGLGAAVLRVDRTPVVGWRSWWAVAVETLAERDALIVDWLTGVDRPRIYLRPSPEHPFSSGALADEPSLLVAVKGVDPGRIVETTALSARRVRFEWVVAQ